MKYLLIAMLLAASAMAHAQVKHDPRCYNAQGIFDEDLGDDDLDCANDPLPITDMIDITIDNITDQGE